MINGILWIQRTGAPWDDLPERYGPPGNVSSHFYRWQNQGIWQRIWEQLQQKADQIGQIDWEVHFGDSTIVCAHQHTAGVKGGQQNEALGRSCGGFSSKIHIGKNELSNWELRIDKYRVFYDLATILASFSLRCIDRK